MIDILETPGKVNCYKRHDQRGVVMASDLWERSHLCLSSGDTFDGAKSRFLNRGKKRRSVLTLRIPRASARGVEWVDCFVTSFLVMTQNLARSC